MSDEPKRVKGGRPRKHAAGAKRPTMSFRISSKLHEALIASAAINERSLSEEIEHRLEQSCAPPDALALVLAQALLSQAPRR